MLCISYSIPVGIKYYIKMVSKNWRGTGCLIINKSIINCTNYELSKKVK